LVPDESSIENVWAWRALGLCAAATWSRTAPGDRDDKLNAGLALMEQAAQLCEGRDAILEWFVGHRLSMRQRDTLKPDAGLESALAMVAIVESGRADDPSASVLRRMVAHPENFRWGTDARNSIAVQSHARVANAARFLRDYELAEYHRDRQIEAAEPLIDVQPNLLCSALGQRATLARSRGDIRTNDMCLGRQRRVAAERTWWVTDANVLLSRGAEAGFFGDYETSRNCKLDRIRVRLTGQGYAIPTPVTPEALAPIIDQITERGNRTLLSSIGNICYDLGENLLNAERCRLDQTARNEARAWFEAAQTAWRDFAMNGQVALTFRFLQLDVLDLRTENPQQVGHQMVQLSREWRRPVGQRRAALQATIDGAAGDSLVLERLTELMSKAPPQDTAHLNVGVARWHRRTGDLNSAEGQLADACGQWQAAVVAADVAAAGLSVRRPGEKTLLLSAVRYVDALTIKAVAIRRLLENCPDCPYTAQDELQARLESLPGIARRISAGGSALYRHVLTQKYEPQLIAAANLAVQLQDHAAIDTITEVVRRDASGAILAGLMSDPDLSEELARLARQITAGLKDSIVEEVDATSERGAPPAPDGTTDDAGPDSPTESDPPLETRAARASHQLAETLDIVGRAIGPLARALFDPDTVSSATAEQLLSLTHGPDAVLSLWLRPDDHLVRRFSWRHAGIQHFADSVPTPDWLPRFEPRTNPRDFVTALDGVADVLLPPPMLEILRGRGVDEPLDLTVIPTGLFGVPFAALPIDDERAVLDAACVTVAQSLTAAMSLAGGPSSPSLGGETLASFDTEGLNYTKSEYSDLRNSKKGRVRPLETLDEFRSALSATDTQTAHDFLVLALHGLRGSDGWSQAKVLPNGQLLRTTHVLEWFMPLLVVGASCDTDIREDGGELGGFPVAFQMRGAKLVLGTLTKVDDLATAEIMGLVYAAMAAGHTPARALREAQRTWISADPRGFRATQRQLWAYHVAYGHSPGSGYLLRPEEAG